MPGCCRMGSKASLSSSFLPGAAGSLVRRTNLPSLSASPAPRPAAVLLPAAAKALAAAGGAAVRRSSLCVCPCPRLDILDIPVPTGAPPFESCRLPESAANRHACSACCTNAASLCGCMLPLELWGHWPASLLRLRELLPPSLLAAAGYPGLLPRPLAFRSHCRGDTCRELCNSAASSPSVAAASIPPDAVRSGLPAALCCCCCCLECLLLSIWKPQLLLCCGAAAAWGDTGWDAPASELPAACVRPE
jgi:hypothetical protein